ncbi:MAG: sarcosine oxidase [Thermomicrobiales bacterium]|nr:sarcosine oxidase [Thermomicrobiales bacterium]
MTEYDVIVVGLGAMGSAAAYHLSRRGERVLGLDAYAAGHTNGSSHGESRIIRLAYYEHPDYNMLLARAYELWAALEAEAGEQLLYPSGGLMFGRPDDELVAESIAAIRRQEREHEILDAVEVRRRYPAFQPDDDEIALFDPRMGILFADRCVAAHRRLAVAHGAVLRDETTVRRWTATADGVEVWTDAGRFRAARLVIAAGPWIGKLLPELARMIGIERIPVFYWQPRESPDLFALGRFPVYMWERRGEGVFYGFPHLTLPGIKAGRHHNEDWCDPDTVERVVTAEDERLVRDFFARHIPALNGEVVERYACLYTTTPDQHFLIDRHPAHANVCYASSCSGHGFKFAAVVGELLADLALTGRTTPAADFLRGERLGVVAQSVSA